MEKFPTHWLCLTTGEYPGLDENGQRIMKMPPDPVGVGVIENRVVQKPRPGNRHHFEGEIVIFNHQPQVPRFDDYVMELDPKTGKPKVIRHSDGSHGYQYLMTDELDENLNLKPAMRDSGVTMFVPLLDIEAREMGAMSKTGRLEAASEGTLHYQQPAHRLAWTLPYSEWPEHGLTPPADYEEPKQPEPKPEERAEQVQISTLEALQESVKALTRRVDASDKRTAAAEKESARLRDENEKLRSGLAKQNQQGK